MDKSLAPPPVAPPLPAGSVYKNRQFDSVIEIWPAIRGNGIVNQRAAVRSRDRAVGEKRRGEGMGKESGGKGGRNKAIPDLTDSNKFARFASRVSR